MLSGVPGDGDEVAVAAAMRAERQMDVEVEVPQEAFLAVLNIGDGKK